MLYLIFPTREAVSFTAESNETKANKFEILFESNRLAFETVEPETNFKCINIFVNMMIVTLTCIKGLTVCGKISNRFIY